MAVNIRELAATGRVVAGRGAGWLRAHAWAVIGILGAVAAVYWPTLGFEFLNWDDPWYVVNNPLIRSWHPANLWGIATEVVSRNYAPVTIFSFLVDHTVWGLWPGGYHLTNVLLHAINGVLVYALIQQLTNNRSAAWIAAALWAVHPVQVESVAWVSSRKGLLSATFLLASSLCWLRPDRSDRHERWALLWFVPALLSKAIAVVVPPIFLSYDMLVRRKSFADAASRQFVPGLLSLWLLVGTMHAQNTMLGGVRSHMELSKLEIVAVDAMILWRYVGVLFWPADLCVLYDPPTSGVAVPAALCALAWAAAVWLASRLRRRFPLLTVSLISWLLLFAPVLNFVPLTTLMNDRYLYLPSIPVFALGATALSRVASLARSRGSTSGGERIAAEGPGWSSAWCCGMVVVVGYALAASQYLSVWRDPMSLWTHAHQHVPQLAVVQIQRANTLQSLDRTDEAIHVLEAALVHCDPDEVDRRRIEEKLTQWRARQGLSHDGDRSGRVR